MNEATKVVKGIVIKEPEEADIPCVYEIEDEGNMYLVISDGPQAIKDYLFIRNGQEVQVEGVGLKGNRIQSRHSRIKIDKEKLV